MHFNFVNNCHKIIEEREQLTGYQGLLTMGMTAIVFSKSVFII